MNYLLQSRKRNTKKFTPLIVSVCFAAFVILIALIAPLFFSGMAHGIGRPLWLTSNFFAARAGDLKAFMLSRHTLLTRTEELQRELLEAQAQLATLSVLEHENQQFKET
jgi:cell shape-determining protein MreC